MKKVLFFILAAMLCLFISCQSSQPVEQQVAQQQGQGQVFLERETGKLQGQPWVNSNVYGNWPESKPAVEENYELYVNYDSYMQAMNSNLTEDSLYDRSDEYQQTIIRQLIEDTSVTSDELELIRAYYGLFSDFDKRNTQGNDPLVEYRDMIVKKNNVEELSAEIQNGLVFGNPFATFAVNAAADGSGKYGVWIDFNLPITSKLEPGYTEEDLENVKAYLVYLLLLASYEQDFAVKMVNLLEDFEMKAFELDKKFVSENELENDAIILTLDEIKDFCTPLYDLIIGLGYYSADDPVCYFIRNAGMFYGIEQMYMDDNINIIDTIYVLSMAEYAKEFLDIKTFAEVNDIEDPETIDINEIAYSFITKYLSGAVDQVYLEFAFPADLRDKITELTKPYMAAMKERLEKIRRIAARYGLKMEVLHSEDVSMQADIDSEASGMLIRVIRKTFPGVGVSPYILTGGTDARIYEKICPNVLRFAPVVFGPEEKHGIHGIDESIPYSVLPGCVDFYRNLIRASADSVECSNTRESQKCESCGSQTGRI